MIARFWALCADLWTGIGAYAADRAKGCLRRMNLAKGEAPNS